MSKNLETLLQTYEVYGKIISIGIATTDPPLFMIYFEKLHAGVNIKDVPQDNHIQIKIIG